MAETNEKKEKIAAFKKQQKNSRISGNLKRMISIILAVCIVLALGFAENSFSQIFYMKDYR